MRRRRGARRTLASTATLAVLALAAIAVTAIVTVFYPITTEISPTRTPPVYFVAGTANGAADVSGTVEVLIGANKTSASVLIHPTYQATLYSDVLRIVNTANKTINVTLEVEDVAELPSGSKVLVIVTDTPTVSVAGFPASNLAPVGAIATVDAVAGGAASFTIPATATIHMHILTYIPEGTTPTNTTFYIYLMYTP